MEISTGDTHIIVEKTVAILLAAVPLALVMQLPPIIKSIRRLVALFLRRQLAEDIQARVLQAEERG